MHVEETQELVDADAVKFLELVAVEVESKVAFDVDIPRVQQLEAISLHQLLVHEICFKICILLFRLGGILDGLQSRRVE